MFEFADPLGIDTAARGAVEAFFTAASAPFHGLSDDPASGEIAVVELAVHGKSWPVPLEEQTKIISAILKSGPKALFVDIRFLEREPGQPLPAFDSVLKTAAEQSIPLLFARGGANWASLPEPLTGHGTINAWEGGPHDYPLQIAPAEHGEGTAGEATELTAAFQLYRSLCSKSALPGRCVGAPDGSRFQNVLHVRWGSSPDPLQHQISEGCEAAGGSWARLLTALRYAAFSLFRVTQSWALQPCRPFLTLQADQLDSGLAGNPAIAERELLEGRVVFYGATIEGDHDIVVAPVLGGIPGVQQHAAAFENLLTYGAGYFHKPTTFEIRGIEFSTVEAVQFVIWLLFIVSLFAGWVDKLSELRDASRVRRVVLIGVVVLGGLAFALDELQVGRPASSAPTFALLYTVLVGLTGVVVWFDGRRGYAWHTLFICVLASWTLVANELWWRLPTTEWLGFVVLYLAAVEALEPDEKSPLVGFVPKHKAHHQASTEGTAP